MNVSLDLASAVEHDVPRPDLASDFTFYDDPVGGDDALDAAALADDDFTALDISLHLAVDEQRAIGNDPKSGPRDQ